MAKHLSPHDRVLRATMAEPKVIKEFFSNYLPVHIKKEIDLDSIKLQKDSFIDDKLRMQITDLLYTAQFGQRQGYLYLLVEHQSIPDRLMPFRLLKYKLNVMDHHLKTTDDKQLPIVYSLIFYSGKRSYNHSTNIFELFGSQKKLAEDIFYRPYQLLDLKQIPDDKLKEQLWFGVLGRIMKHIYSKNILPYFRNIIPELKIIERHGNNDYTFRIISYLFEASELQDQNEFIETVKIGLTINEEKIMTLAEQYRAQGRAEEREELLRQMTLNMLNRGMDSKEVAQIANITEDDLRLLLGEEKQRDD